MYMQQLHCFHKLHIYHGVYMKIWEILHHVAFYRSTTSRMKKAGQPTFSTWHLEIILLRQAHWKSLIKTHSNVTVNVDLYASIDKKAEKSFEGSSLEKAELLSLQSRGLGSGCLPGWVGCGNRWCLSVHLFRWLWEWWLFFVLSVCSVLFINLFFGRQECGNTFLVFVYLSDVGNPNIRQRKNKDGGWHAGKTNNWLSSTALFPFSS